MSRKPKAADDNPQWTKADFRAAKRGQEMPERMRRFFPKTRQRGPQKAPTKVATSIRLSPEVVAHFKATGPGWQTRIDEALKELIEG